MYTVSIHSGEGSTAEAVNSMVTWLVGTQQEAEDLVDALNSVLLPAIFKTSKWGQVDHWAIWEPVTELIGGTLSLPVTNGSTWRPSPPRDVVTFDVREKLLELYEGHLADAGSNDPFTDLPIV